MIGVTKKKRESTSALLRRFSREVRQSGILYEARRKRYHTKPKSDNQQKESALRREKLKKLRRKMLKTGQIGPKEKIDLSKVRE